jgi:hypothetical protein
MSGSWIPGQGSRRAEPRRNGGWCLPTIRLAPSLIGLTLLVPVSGCGGDSGALKQVAVYPVTGSVVRADGKPLGGGQIYFVPNDGAVTSEGKIETDGSFHLVTGNSGEGAPPGEFKIRIEPADPALIANKKAKSSGRGLPFSARYLDEDSSGLTASIKSEPNTLEPFRLK